MVSPCPTMMRVLYRMTRRRSQEHTAPSRARARGCTTSTKVVFAEPPAPATQLAAARRGGQLDVRRAVGGRLCKAGRCSRWDRPPSPAAARALLSPCCAPLTHPMVCGQVQQPMRRTTSRRLACRRDLPVLTRAHLWRPPKQRRRMTTTSSVSLGCPRTRQSPPACPPSTTTTSLLRCSSTTHTHAVPTHSLS